MNSFYFLYPELGYTPPKFNIDPEKSWLEDNFPIGKVTFQERTVKLRGCIITNWRFLKLFEKENGLNLELIQ